MSSWGKVERGRDPYAGANQDEGGDEFCFLLALEILSAH